MDVTNILEQLKGLGIQLWMTDGTLAYRASEGEVRPEIRHLLEKHRKCIEARLFGVDDERENSFPLSYNQKSLWFLNHVAPDTSAYNISLSCRIVSTVCPDAMHEACRQLVHRHDILRTTYGVNHPGGDPMQTVHTCLEPEFQLVDLSGCAEEALTSTVTEHHARPFDLEHGPLVRLTLFKRSDKEHVFLLTMHHIACDGSSLGGLTSDFDAFYRAAVSGREPILSESSRHYSDFVGYQRKMLRGEEGRRLKTFWGDCLEGAPAAMELPFDFPRPGHQRFEGETYPWALAGQVYADIRVAAERAGVTRYVLLLSLFQLTLMRWCQEEDVVVGVPVSGRRGTAFTEYCGHFANMVAMRGQLQGAVSFHDYLTKNRRRISQALDHHAYPFSLLVESLAVERDPSCSPVFQVMFNMLNRRVLGAAAPCFLGVLDEPALFGGMKVMPYAQAQAEGQFDLSLEVIDSGTRLACFFKYRSDIFTRETMAALADLFHETLQAFMVAPDRAIPGLRIPHRTSREKAYWMDRLTGNLPVLQLPWVKGRTAYGEYRCCGVSFEISGEETVGLGERCAREGVSGASLFLTVYLVLLARYCGQESAVIGVPVEDGLVCGSKEQKGHFSSILPVRVDIPEACTFHELNQRVEEALGDALAHQGVNYREMMALNVSGAESPSDHHPLCQVLFSFEDESAAGGPCFSPSFYPGGEGTHIGCDLSLFVWGEGGRWHGAFLFNEALGQRNAVQRMCESFQVLLESVVRGWEGTVDRMPLLSGDERHRLICRWNSTSRKYPAHVTLQGMFDEQVRKTPDAVAVIYESRTVTYRELSERANRLAHYLQKLGVGPEELVGIFMNRSMEMIVAIYGILKAGGAYVPLDPDYPADRLGYMLEDTRVLVVLTQEALKEVVPEHPAKVVCLDSQWDMVAKENAEVPVAGVTENNLAYVIYTSGSTGRPKGVMNTHKGICNRLYWMQEAYGLTRADVVLQKTPYSFDVSVWEFFWPLLFGARLVVPPPGLHKDPVALRELIDARGVTILHFVPSMMQLFLRENLHGMCPSLKKVICSGEALSCELQTRFFEALDAELHNLYGPTEAAVDVTFWACRRDSQMLTVPIGKPVANTQIYILDHHMAPVPVGVAGELHIGGVQVARGYLNLSELTRERFVPDPFSQETGARLYKTGDLARYLPDGNIEYLGRNDFQVKVRGLRIELGEIESVMCSHPDISEAVVVAKGDAQEKTRIIAYFVSCGTGLATDTVRGMLSTMLPDYMVPSVFMQMPALPLLGNGKVDRNALPEPSTRRPDLATSYAAPITEVEKVITDIWQSLLGVERVGMDDNFFDVGGDSFLVVQAVSRLAAAFDVELSVAHLFEHPTIRGFACLVEKKPEEVSMGEGMEERLRKRREMLARKKQTRQGARR